jgi:predicted kinase
MPTLIITRGLPASGKSTRARAWVDARRAHRARVNRDDLRTMLDYGVFEKGVTEPRILAARDALILGLLAKGLDVICDDTNLPQRSARDLARLARRAGAGFEVEDFTDVPLETCIERDAARGDKKPVGEAVIRDMHARYLAGRVLPLPLPEEPTGAISAVAYEARPGTPRAVMVDIDGTVALMGARSPFDETRVHEDRPNLAVITVVRAMVAAGNAVVFLSGRTAACREATYLWLNKHAAVPFQGLYMRAEGDTRKDAIVKGELFDRHVREHYDVTCVLDDRDQVVAMWRSLGLTVLQVADGNF